MTSRASTAGGGVLGANCARAAVALPSQRSVWKLSACVPGRISAGTRASTSVNDRPVRTACTASAVWSSRRCRAGEGRGVEGVAKAEEEVGAPVINTV